MKVLLCTTPCDKPRSTIPDIGLGFLAAALRTNGHDVQVLQPEGRGVGFEPVGEIISRENPDFIGFKVFSRDIKFAKDALMKIKAYNKKIITAIGGPHPSCSNPEGLLFFFEYLDFAFAGEADRSLPDLINMLETGNLSLENVSGLVYKKNNRFVANTPDVIEDLDSLNFPSWDLIDPRNFNNRWMFWLKGLPAAPIIFSRGCPFTCTFCNQQVVSGKKVRSRTPDHVLKEIIYMINNFGVKHFDFIDDNFIVNKKHVRSLCEKILEAKLNIEWSCGGVHLNTIDPEIINLMGKAGCKAIGVGIESGNDEILKHMQKKITSKEIENRLRLIKKHSDILIMGQFILGYPLDTLKTIKETIDFSCHLPIDLATFYTFIPIPGSTIFDYLVEKGEIKNMDWETLSMDNSVYSPPGVSIEKLVSLFKFAYLRFYLRPRTVYRMLKEFSAPSQIREYWLRARSKFFR